MNEVSRSRIAKNTVMLYIRMVLTVLVTLYTSRIVLEVLGSDDYGLYSVVGGVVVMVGFLNVALSSATQRFLSFEIGRGGDVQRLFSTSLMIHLILAGVVLVVAETLGVWFINNQLVIEPDRLVAANWVYQFSLLTVLVNIVSVPYNALIISHERMELFAYISIFEVILKLLLVVMLLRVGGDKLILYAFLMFMVGVVVRIIYQVYCRRLFSESRFRFVWDRNMIGEMISYTGWSLMGALSYSAKNQGVGVVLNLFYGVAINAAWGISQQISVTVLGFASNFTVALNPPIVKSYANGEIKNAVDLLFMGMKYSFILSLVMVVPMILNMEYICSVWLKNTPQYAVMFAQLALIVVVVESLTNPISYTMQATGKIRSYQIVVGVLMLLNLPLSYFALKRFDNPQWILYIAIVIAILGVGARLVMLRRMVKFSLKDLALLVVRLVVITIFTLPVVCLRSVMSGGVVTLIATTVVAVVMIGVSSYMFGLTRGERQFVVRKAKELTAKFGKR